MVGFDCGSDTGRIRFGFKFCSNIQNSEMYGRLVQEKVEYSKQVEDWGEGPKFVIENTVAELRRDYGCHCLVDC